MTRNIGDAPNPNADPQAKDKFKNLDSDFKDAAAQSTPEENYKRITNLSAQIEALATAKELDGDFQAKKSAKEAAEEPYKLQTKDLKLRIKYILRVLGDQGKV